MCVLFIRASVEHTIRLEDVAAWMCGNCPSVSFPLDGFLVLRQVTWNQPTVFVHSDDF